MGCDQVSIVVPLIHLTDDSDMPMFVIVFFSRTEVKMCRFFANHLLPPLSDGLVSRRTRLEICGAAR
jgi:hypothetical protein